MAAWVRRDKLLPPKCLRSSDRPCSARALDSRINGTVSCGSISRMPWAGQATRPPDDETEEVARERYAGGGGGGGAGTAGPPAKWEDPPNTEEGRFVVSSGGWKSKQPSRLCSQHQVCFSGGHCVWMAQLSRLAWQIHGSMF